MAQSVDVALVRTKARSEMPTVKPSSDVMIDFYIPFVVFLSLLGVYFLILGIALAAFTSAARKRKQLQATRRMESFRLEVGCSQLRKYRKFVFRLPKFPS
jgi:hypothetical protein